MANEFTQRRILEASAVALASTEHGLGKVAINKVLFYADLHALLDHGESITESSYLALRMGPVVKGYERNIVEALAKEGCLKTGAARRLVVTHVPELQVLPSFAADILVAQAKRLEGLTAAHISELSHRNPGWKAAWEIAQEKNGQGQPINMLRAMEELLEPDPWMEEGGEHDAALLNLAALQPLEAGAIWK